VVVVVVMVMVVVVVVVVAEVTVVLELLSCECEDYEKHNKPRLPRLFHSLPNTFRCYVDFHHNNQTPHSRAHSYLTSVRNSRTLKRTYELVRHHIAKAIKPLLTQLKLYWVNAARRFSLSLIRDFIIRACHSNLISRKATETV
jgi:hypothetical protein